MKTETIEFVGLKEAGRRLRKLRESAGWTLEQVSEYMKKPTEWLVDVEKGEITIGTVDIEKLCDLYFVSDWELATAETFDTTYKGFGSKRICKKTEEEVKENNIEWDVHLNTGIQTRF